MAQSLSLVASLLLLAGPLPAGATPYSDVFPEHQEDALLPELSASLARGNTSFVGSFSSSVKRDFAELRKELAPALLALPYDTEGRFSSTAVRYALHRLFIRVRGWSLVGLDPEGQAWNGTWTSKVALLGQAPASVRHVIAERLEGPGLSGNDVVAFAVLLQHLAREDAAKHLHEIFVALDLPLDKNLTQQGAMNAIDALMASQVLSRTPGAVGRNRWLREVQSIKSVYPNWPELQAAIHEDLIAQLRVLKPDFSGLAQAAGAVGERWGRWGDSECRSLKHELMSMEDRGSGRVHLADFYGKALHEGKWQLTESVEYLRQLGALDETNPSNPRVIIPNYVGASGNCIASSDIMSVCCISECEDLLHQLQVRLRSPEATVEAIATAVAQMPSSTVTTKRELSAVMLNRLNRIAADNDGLVPLHGRLFAQWMHHAYPRECPYPYLSGKTKQLQMDAFAAQTGHSITASRSQMAALAGKDARSWKVPSKSRPLENAPWSHEEELFVPPTQRPDAFVMLHASVLAAALAVGALGYSLLHLARNARRQAAEACDGAPPKLYQV